MLVLGGITSDLFHSISQYFNYNSILIELVHFLHDWLFYHYLLSDERVGFIMVYYSTIGGAYHIEIWFLTPYIYPGLIGPTVR